MKTLAARIEFIEPCHLSACNCVHSTGSNQEGKGSWKTQMGKSVLGVAHMHAWVRE
jgi:hypothetical protein